VSPRRRHFCSIRVQFRPLASTDYSRGHLRVLGDLTLSPDVGEDAWRARFALVRSIPDTYFIVVFVDTATDDIVAVGSLIIERKFMRGLGVVGHIEDIVVGKEGQGHGLGKKLIETLTHIAFEKGAYKVILDCDPKNVGKLSTRETTNLFPPSN
jgi:glucosamine-phosphate N-acetyltransferase